MLEATIWLATRWDDVKEWFSTNLNEALALCNGLLGYENNSHNQRIYAYQEHQSEFNDLYSNEEVNYSYQLIQPNQQSLQAQNSYVGMRYPENHQQNSSENPILGA